MLDAMAMCQFLLMVSNLLGVVSAAGGDMGYDWKRMSRPQRALVFDSFVSLNG